MNYQEYKIEKEFKSIYHFLKDHDFSENFISNLRKTWGNFVVNNEIVNIRKGLNEGDILQINPSPNAKTAIMHCRIPLNLVFEDEYYLLINKPAGISTMPNRSHYKNNLAGAICAYMEEKDPNFVLRIANRLDKDTSGLVLVAKSSIAQKELSNVEKVYYAICEGVIENNLVIDEKILTISENGINQRKRIISPLGQEAKTFAEPIKNDGKHTLLKIKLEHGRTHQIRVHMAHIGHPLVGDELYGTKSSFISRAALHCKQISFWHEFEKKNISFSAPIPPDFFIQ